MARTLVAQGVRTLGLTLVLLFGVASAHAEGYRCVGERPTQDESDAAAAVEWKRAAVRGRVGKDLGYYKTLRYYYVAQRGICDVGTYLTERVVLAPFLGFTLRVHQDVAEALRRAEGRLVPAPKVRRIGSLQVRTIRGPFGRSPWLSNHALGTAIDIEPGRNLYLSPDELEVLSEVSGLELLLNVDHDAGARWDSLDRAQSAFVAKVGPWRRAQSRRARELQRLARKGDAGAAQERDQIRAALKTAGGRKLRAARRKGFLNLPRALVVALEAEGMTWCTDFVSGADLMHFEMRTAL